MATVPTQRLATPAAATPPQRLATPAAATPPQQAAALAFANLTITGLKPLLADVQQNLLNELEAIRVSLSGIEARLSEREAVAKRLPRSSKVTGAAKAPGAPNEAVGDEAIKPPTNVMFFCRYQWALDESFRKRFTTPRVQTVLNDPKLLALPLGQKRLLAEGSRVWKDGLTEDEKTAVRDEYGRWKKQQTVDCIADPLELETGGNLGEHEEVDYQDESVL